MRVLILAFSGLLLLGSTVAFLLYVSILSILTVVVVLLAGVLMFLLGVHMERQLRPAPENPSDGRTPEVQEARKTRTTLTAVVLSGDRT